MPRGAKGWPIVTYEGPGRPEVFCVVGIFGVFFPLVLAGSVSAYGTNGGMIGMMLVMAPLFGGVILYLLGLMYLAGGYVKWTPTAALWVPPFFKPKFVRFADAVRLRKSSKRVIFDSGSVVNLPAVGHLRGVNSEAFGAQRRQVDVWLDEQFAPYVADPARKWKAAIRLITALAFVPAVLIGPVVLKQIRPFVFPLVRSLPPSQRGTAAAVIAMGVMLSIMALPFAGLAVARFAFGVDLRLRPSWRLRRDKWQGFEVRTLPPVASPPPPI